MLLNLTQLIHETTSSMPLTDEPFDVVNFKFDLEMDEANHLKNLEFFIDLVNLNQKASEYFSIPFKGKGNEITIENLNFITRTFSIYNLQNIINWLEEHGCKKLKFEKKENKSFKISITEEFIKSLTDKKLERSKDFFTDDAINQKSSIFYIFRYAFEPSTENQFFDENLLQTKSRHALILEYVHCEMKFPINEGGKFECFIHFYSKSKEKQELLKKIPGKPLKSKF